jgi:diguanylate cyclase (GGDEF)-like protein
MDDTESNFMLSEPSAPAAPGARPRVLVVDDSRVIRQAIKKILSADFDIVLAESGDSGWSLLGQDPTIQALVTDIEMPGMDGYELICSVRGSDQARFKDMPILAITGAEDEQTKERAFACGATDFITKPINTIELKARVQAYARMDQATRDLAERATQLEEQSISDPLTGLNSRRYFLQRAEQDIAYCLRHGKDLTLLRLDIDGFRELYQQHGDDTGDRILAWLAGILKATARVEDTVARVAGAKFGIVAVATSIEDAMILGQRISETVRAQPFQQGQTPIKISLSAGLASLKQDQRQDIEHLFKLAEQRMVHAKSEGGDRVCSSILGEAPAPIEEVVLDAPVGQSDPDTMESATDNTMPGLAGLDDLTPPVSAEAEILDLTLEIPDIVPAVVAAPDDFSQLISVDKALQLIEAGRAGVVRPYLDGLMRQLKPLLDLYEQYRDGRSPQRKRSL